MRGTTATVVAGSPLLRMSCDAIHQLEPAVTSSFPPSRPTPPPGPPVEDWPGRALGLPATGPGSLASFGQRLGARGIDIAVCFALAGVLIGVEAAVRAITGVEAPAEDDGDAISVVLGLVMLATWVAYDPVTTAIWGRTIGKRIVGLQVVSVDDGTAAPLLVVAGRNVIQLLLWLACIVPGVLDLRAGWNDPDRRTWHDRALSTIVIRKTGSPHRRPGPAARMPLHALPAPWEGLVAEATAAQQRLDHTIAATGSGPVQERLADARTRVADCVAQCGDVASRGARLQMLAGTVDVDGVRARHHTALQQRDADPGNRAATELAAALEGEIASAERVHQLVADTELTLRRLVSQLNDSVNRAAEVAFAPDGTGFDVLVDQLESLRLAFAEAQESASIADT